MTWSARGLSSMLEMYALTGDVRYYHAFASTLDFIEQHQVASCGVSSMLSTMPKNS